MKHLLLLSAIALSFPAHVRSAQQFATNNGIKVSFPTPSWSETAPPPELLATYDDSSSPVRLVFYAVSQPSRLRLHITKFGYPPYPPAPKEIFLAGYLSGLRQRCARQATGSVAEHLDLGGALPVQTFEADVSGGLFLEMKAVFCAERVFLMEIEGPTTSRTEAKQCLDGVSIVGESALPVVLFTRLSQARAQTGHARAQTGQLRVAHERGPRLGYGLGVAISAVLFIGFIAVRVFACGKQVS